MSKSQRNQDITACKSSKFGTLFLSSTWYVQIPESSRSSLPNLRIFERIIYCLSWRLCQISGNQVALAVKSSSFLEHYFSALPMIMSKSLEIKSFFFCESSNFGTLFLFSMIMSSLRKSSCSSFAESSQFGTLFLFPLDNVPVSGNPSALLTTNLQIFDFSFHIIFFHIAQIS